MTAPKLPARSTIGPPELCGLLISAFTIGAAMGAIVVQVFLRL
jgi:hypothetical protein